MPNVEKFNTLIVGVSIFYLFCPRPMTFMFFGQQNLEDQAFMLPWNVTNHLPRDMVSYPKIMGPQHTEDVGSRFLRNCGTYLPNYQEAMILEMLYFTVLH